MPNIREQIASLLEKPKLTPVKFGGFDCFVRRWNARERIENAIELQSATQKIALGDDDETKVDAYFMCKAIARSLCDESGELIFDSWEEVAKHDTETLGPVFLVVNEVQAVNMEDDDAKKN